MYAVLPQNGFLNFDFCLLLKISVTLSNHQVFSGSSQFAPYSQTLCIFQKLAL